MAVTIERSSHFLGHPMKKMRAILREFEQHNRSIDSIARHPNVKLDLPDALAIISELYDRDLITSKDAPTPLTDAGLSLARAPLRNRLTRAVAKKRLAQFLIAVKKSRDEPTFPILIEKVWIYGSFLTDSETLGNVNIVIEGDDKAEFNECHTLDQAAKFGFTTKYSHSAYEFLVRHHLHANTKHDFLRLGNLRDLCKSGAPCKLVFDATRGGPVDDPVLDRHPEPFVSGPYEYVYADFEQKTLEHLQDLGPKTDLLPIDTALFRPHEWSVLTVFTVANRPTPHGLESDMAAFNFMDAYIASYPDDWFTAIAKNCKAKKTELHGLNGRTHSAIATTNDLKQIVIFFTRTIAEHDDTVEYALTLSRAIANPGSTNRPVIFHEDDITPLAQALNVLVHADLALISGRDTEAGRTRTIKTDFENYAGEFGEVIAKWLTPVRAKFMEQIVANPSP